MPTQQAKRDASHAMLPLRVAREHTSPPNSIKNNPEGEESSRCPRDLPTLREFPPHDGVRANQALHPSFPHDPCLGTVLGRSVSQAGSVAARKPIMYFLSRIRWIGVGAGLGRTTFALRATADKRDPPPSRLWRARGGGGTRGKGENDEGCELTPFRLPGGLVGKKWISLQKPVLEDDEAEEGVGADGGFDGGGVSGMAKMGNRGHSDSHIPRQSPPGRRTGDRVRDNGRRAQASRRRRGRGADEEGEAEDGRAEVFPESSKSITTPARLPKTAETIPVMAKAGTGLKTRSRFERRTQEERARPWVRETGSEHAENRRRLAKSCMPPEAWDVSWDIASSRT